MSEKWRSTKDEYPETRQKVWFTINYGKEVVRGIFCKRFENQYTYQENIFVSDANGHYSPDKHGEIKWKPSPTPEPPAQQKNNPK